MLKLMHAYLRILHQLLNHGIVENLPYRLWVAADFSHHVTLHFLQIVGAGTSAGSTGCSERRHAGESTQTG